jgi:crotonobetainyl-CoA:carnitine CoA-transferase CaiB-like acyl-CoA transferase
VAIGDLLAGMNATQSVLAAVIARDRDGTGQHLDIALLDGQVAAMMNVASEYLITGVPPRRFGNAHPSVVPYQAFPAADGYFVLAVGNNSQFLTLCRDVIDRPGLVSDERFHTNAARVENRDALSDILSTIFKTRPAADWLEKLTSCGVPNGKIRNIAEVLNAPEVIARNMVWEVEHRELGSFRMIGSPLKFSETPMRPLTAPPALGEHTAEVLRDVFKVSAERMTALQARGALGGK